MNKLLALISVIAFTAQAETSLMDEYSEFVDAHYVDVEIAHKLSNGCKKTADEMLENPSSSASANSPLFRCWENLSNFVVNTVWDYEKFEEIVEQPSIELTKKEEEFNAMIDDIKSNLEYVEKTRDIIP